jgi:hypothetical protein
MSTKSTSSTQHQRQAPGAPARRRAGSMASSSSSSSRRGSIKRSSLQPKPIELLQQLPGPSVETCPQLMPPPRDTMMLSSNRSHLHQPPSHPHHLHFPWQAGIGHHHHKQQWHGHPTKTLEGRPGAGQDATWQGHSHSWEQTHLCVSVFQAQPGGPAHLYLSPEPLDDASFSQLQPQLLGITVTHGESYRRYCDVQNDCWFNFYVTIEGEFHPTDESQAMFPNCIYHRDRKAVNRRPGHDLAHFLADPQMHRVQQHLDNLLARFPERMGSWHWQMLASVWGAAELKEMGVSVAYVLGQGGKEDGVAVVDDDGGIWADVQEEEVVEQVDGL